MEKEHEELVRKHIAALVPKLQKVIEESELKDFSIDKLHLKYGIAGCPPPGGCPQGQNCPWMDSAGVIHYYCG